MTTNIDIHQEWECKRDNCSYEVTIGVTSKKFFRVSMPDCCRNCGGELVKINDL